MAAIRAYAPPRLANALEAEGFELPHKCRKVTLVTDVDGLFVLHYEVLVTEADLARLGRALVRMTQDNDA